MNEPGHVHQLFSELILEWCNPESAPQATIQAACPAFAERAGMSYDDFTFDAFFHSGDNEGWSWRALEFSEVFAGAFTIYLPDRWSDVRIHRTTANVLEGDKIRQSIFVLDKASWVETLPSFLTEFEVEAFVHYLLLSPGYDQWVFSTRDKNRDIDWLYAVFSASDWLFVIKADAAERELLLTQLTSILNSNPWFGWIEQARKQAGAASPG